MISVHIPTFSYKQGVILKNINYQFASGVTHGVVGLNGAGKTTFFNLLGGFLKSNGCSFNYNNSPLAKKDIGVIDTEMYFYPKITAREFLSVFKAGNNSYHEEKLATTFKLPLDSFTEEFSSGMKKKLLLMSQIKQDKDIYILDEPFNGLDLETNKMLEAIISTLNSRGKTVFISSHILEPLFVVCNQIHYIKEQTLHRSYNRNEFEQIEEHLFGSYKKQINDELGLHI